MILSSLFQANEVHINYLFRCSLKLNNFVRHEHGKCYINQIYEKNAIDPKKNLITVISSAYVSNSGGIYDDNDDD